MATDDSARALPTTAEWIQQQEAACFGAEALSLEAINTFLHENKGQVVQLYSEGGYCLVRLEQDVLVIVRLGVLPGHRRQGVATGLLARVEAMARHHGLWNVQVETGRHNAPAIALYLRNGFILEAADDLFFSFRKPVFEGVKTE